MSYKFNDKIICQFTESYFCPHMTLLLKYTSMDSCNCLSHYPIIWDFWKEELLCWDAVGSIWWMCIRHELEKLHHLCGT